MNKHLFPIGVTFVLVVSVNGTQSSGECIQFFIIVFDLIFLLMLSWVGGEVLLGSGLQGT